MKVLMLTPYFPYPLISGGQIRSYNLIKKLAKKHRITLFSFIREEKEKRYIPHLEKFCSKVKVFKRRKAWSPLNILLAGLTPFPFLVAIYYSLTLKRAIKSELQSFDYDLIHAETFYVMPNIPKTKIPILLVEQTIEYLVYQNFVQTIGPWLLKPLLYFDVLKIKFWEKHFWQKAKSLSAMSTEDKNLIQKMVNKDIRIEVIANGVDIEFFNKTKKTKTHQPTILFVGNFKWIPNLDAVNFLVKDIWPKIKREVKNAKLWIVGQNPTEQIKKLTSLKKDILVDDAVEDIRDAFSKSDILLAPIRNGRGTKYKVLEAMATSTPVVATPIWVEGIEVLDKTNVLIANNATGLAEKTVFLIKNRKFGQALAKEARELVSKKFNWENIAKKLDKLYHETGKV
jgi:glycosyltransferase involved in cell wall biosynthesis